MLLSLSSPDESSLKYEVEFLLNHVWHDPRLQYQDGGRHKYLNALAARNSVWIPDTYFIMHGEFKYPVEPVHMALKVYPNGTLLYTTRHYMVITCEGNLRIFPFDSPKCFFGIESMTKEKEHLVLRWQPPIGKKCPIVGGDFVRTLNAYPIKNATGPCGKKHSWRNEFSCLSVYLVFTRDKSFYFSTVFVPGMVLVTSSFISFWLDVNAVPARVMIGVTTMLNFCTTTNSFRSSLPVVSNLTAMNLWDFVCMIFIYASMLEFIIVNYLHRKMHHTSSNSRPISAEQPGDIRQSLANQLSSNGRKLNEPSGQEQLKDELEVRAPLVSGEDPGRSPMRTGSQMNHRGASRPTSPLGVPGPAGGGASRPSSAMDTDRVRAAASVFAWLRRPNIFQPQEMSSQARLARSIDHISKTIFPFLYGVFSFTFFAVFAGYMPSLVDEWIADEYSDIPPFTDECRLTDAA
ncbi:Glutamate-gated chloride channel [Halotydeus destructor]|nr:Glutamate-gated chloride channel [Halotydeus destructor]